jgi:putative FmdB family regulatory protein
MPIYEYECQACGHTFEEWQKMSDKPVRVCPKCKARKVQKLISQTSFQLKGGGWYSDLYASQKPASSSSSESGAGEKAAASSGEGSTGSAPKPPTDGKGKGKGKKGASKAAA